MGPTQTPRDDHAHSRRVAVLECYSAALDPPVGTVLDVGRGEGLPALRIRESMPGPGLAVRDRRGKPGFSPVPPTRRPWGELCDLGRKRATTG